MGRWIPNPDYQNAPIVMTIMTREGCYHREGNQWYVFCGYDEMDQAIWRAVEPSLVPKSFRKRYG